MKNNYIKFLEEYKELCIKHKLQIRGWDNGAYVSELSDEEYDLECLGWEEEHFSDGSVGHSDLRFRDKSDFKNSLMNINTYASSTRSIKEEQNG